MSLKFQPVPDVRLKAVDVDGGHLGEDGAAEGRGKGQEKPAQKDLGGGVDPRVPVSMHCASCFNSKPLFTLNSLIASRLSGNCQLGGKELEYYQ